MDTVRINYKEFDLTIDHSRTLEELLSAAGYESEHHLGRRAPPRGPCPPPPQEVIFAAKDPMQGFSNCTHYGFKGVVTAGNGKRLQGVQIVVWEDKAGLLALSNTDATGNYLIDIEAKSAQRKLWIQVFEDDLPVSQPVFVETQIDCQTGFQFYQIDWQQVSNP